MPAISSTRSAPTRTSAGKSLQPACQVFVDHPVIGRLVEVSEGRIIVSLSVAGMNFLRPARATSNLDRADVGKEVVLIFANGRIEEPIIVGILQPPPGAGSVRVKADEERLTLTAAKEIVLECGEASITLTKAGKVLIRGAYILSRSSGVNRIKGGSVQIN
jgi:hypothetical protein